MRFIARSLATLGLAATLIAAPAVEAQATTAPDCKTVSSTLKDHPDNGHGTGGSPAGHWADVSGTRTVTVCVVDEPVLKKDLVVQAATFHATVKDVGTLVTFGGNTLSPNHGVKLLADVKGAWAGGFEATFQAPKPTAPGVWPNWSPGALDGKAFTGSSGPKTGEWVKSLWTGAELKVDENGWTAKYRWTYSTCNEQWIDADNNKDGQGPGAGDITGLGKFAGKCFQVSFLDKCDGVQVTLGNQAPSDSTVISYFVNGVKHDVKGGTPMLVLTVSPDSHGLVIVKARGHADWTHHYVRPICASPTPTGTGTPVVPVDNGGTPSLPVTGPAVTGLLIGACALIGIGAAVFIAARRRRIRFTP